MEVGTSRDRNSEEEVETSEDITQEVATKVTEPQTKARGRVLIKPLVSELRAEGTVSTVDPRAHPAVKAPSASFRFLIISQPHFLAEGGF